MADYKSLDEVMEILQIDEGKLRELIAEGKLRSFRDPSGEKFLADQVQKLTSEVKSEPTIELPSSKKEEPPALQDDTEKTEPAAEETTEQEPTAEEPEKGKEDEEEPQTVIPTIELSFDEEDDTSSETMIPTIELSPDEEEEEEGADTMAPTEALAPEDEATDVATEEVALSDDDYVILDEKPDDESSMDFSETETDTSDETATDSVAPGAIEFEEEPAKHTFSTVMLGLAAVLLLAGIYLFYTGVRPPMHPDLRAFLLHLVEPS